MHITGNVMRRGAMARTQIVPAACVDNVFSQINELTSGTAFRREDKSSPAIDLGDERH